MKAKPTSTEFETDAVILADLDAATGDAPPRAATSAGVIYGSNEEFLAHLADGQFELPVE